VRKNDLIKLLQDIEGNPEIMLWNGFVSDFVPIGNVGTHSLVKVSKEHWLRVLAEEVKGRKKKFTQKELDKLYARNISYEVNNFVTAEEIRNGTYKQKKIAFIDAKEVGKTSVGWGSSLSY